MEWTNDKVINLIDLYQDRPVLWDCRLKEYKDRNKRMDALLEIAVSFGVEKEEIERKIKNLVCHFSRELKKEREGIKSGAGSDDVYKSKWFCYNSMLFLKDRNRPRGMTDMHTQEPEVVMRIYDAEKNEEEAEHTIVEDYGENYDNNEICSKTAIPPNVPSNRGKRKRELSTSETIQSRMEDACKIKSLCEKQDKDECSLYTKLLAKKLRAFDENTRDILMHEIDNLVFCAKMQRQNLHRQPLSSPSHSSHAFGGLYDYPPFSYNQHLSHVSLPSPSGSQFSSGNSPFSQPSPRNVPTVTGNQASSVPSETVNTS